VAWVVDGNVGLPARLVGYRSCRRSFLEVTRDELTRILADDWLADLRARPKRPGGS
jgi:hypothetical protein